MSELDFERGAHHSTACSCGALTSNGHKPDCIVMQKNKCQRCAELEKELPAQKYQVSILVDTVNREKAELSVLKSSIAKVVEELEKEPAYILSEESTLLQLVKLQAKIINKLKPLAKE